ISAKPLSRLMASLRLKSLDNSTLILGCQFFTSACHNKPPQ
ncbi:bacterial regulatory helix-turn-helix s, AraC family protein, partial [Vibrio parahaemolyticus V-223/04]